MEFVAGPHFGGVNHEHPAKMARTRTDWVPGDFGVGPNQAKGLFGSGEHWVFYHDKDGGFVMLPSHSFHDLRLSLAGLEE